MKIAQNPFLRRGMVAAITLPMAITAYADITLTTGHNIIDTTGDPALGVISRSTGATAWFDNNGTATATGTPLVNGILGPWASIGTGTGTRYATLDGSNNVVGFTGGTAAAGFGWPSGNDATFNYDVAAVQTALGVSRTGNTARYTGAAGTQTWGNSSANVTITLNGLMNAGTGTLTFAKGGTGTGTGVVIGATQELVLNAANAGIAISAPIFNNSAGASALTIIGPGGVTLSGANTYTGPTTIGSGTLTLTGSGTLGSGAINVFSGASLNLNKSLTISQAVSGGGSITSTSGITITGDFSGFTGTYTHNSTTASSVFNTDVSTSADASYVLASAQGSAQGLIAAGAGDYTLQMGSLSGVANSLIRGGGFVTGTTTLQVGNLNTDTTFEGTIANGTAATNPKILALTKVGDGTLTLSGASTYTGATTISAGTLAVNGNISTSMLTTVSGGSLQGSGAVGDLTVTSGTVAPGNSIESLGAGNVSLGASSTYAYELDSAVLNGDLLYSSGTLDIASGSILTLAELASGTLNSGKLTLISYTGEWNNGLFEYLGGTLEDDSVITLGANQWRFNYNDLTGGDNFSADQTGATGFVTMTVIPEPSAAALLGAFGLLGLLRRRR